MSTDRKRLTSAIQRIAREDPKIRKLLDDFRNSGGKPSESATSGSGAEDRQLCCDGSTASSANPGISTRDASSGGQDASDGLGEDPAKLDSGPGSLTGLKDCITDESICFDGSDWIPPVGWEAPTDPPPDPTWQSGYAWEGSGSDPIYASVPQGALNEIQQVMFECNGWDEITEFRYTVRVDQNDDCEYFGVFSIFRVECPVAGHEDACTDEAPTVDSWPSDGCINLANKGGKLVASKYDPEAQGTSYLKGVDSIELCDDFGNSFELAPAANGGWKTINSTTNNGYLYDSSGKQIAHIDGNEYSDPSV